MNIPTTYLVIPKRLSSLRIADQPLDRELIDLLRAADCDELGDLDGRSVDELLPGRTGRQESLFRSFLNLIGAREVDGEPVASLHAASAYMEAHRLQGRISIPERLKPTPLARLDLDVRIFNVLTNTLRMTTLGELDGYEVANLMGLRNFGRNSARKLLDFIAQLGEVPAIPESPGMAAGSIEIPEWAQDWPLKELPLTARIESVLCEDLGFSRLGDLGGVTFELLMKRNNFGKSSATELQSLLNRIRGGEFGQSSVADGFPEVSRFESAIDFFRQHMNQTLEKTDARERDMLTMRLGLSGDTPATLEEIARKYDVSREAIRQIIDIRLTGELTRSGGPRLTRALAVIRNHLHSLYIPCPADQFTSALLHFLDPEIPVLVEVPSGQNSGVSRDATRMRQVLRDLISGYSMQPVRIAEACRHVVENIPGMTIGRFYNSVSGLGGFEVLRENGEAFVKRSSLMLRDIALAALEESVEPMTGEQIREWAVARHLISADKPVERSIIQLAMAAGETELMLLGPQRIGLRRHIKLPEKLWEIVRQSFAAYLTRADLPVPVGHFLRDVQETSSWAGLTNAYELAVIMSLDDQKRFTWVARGMVFALSASRHAAAGRIPQIKDVIRSYLEKCGGAADYEAIGRHVATVRQTTGLSSVLKKMEADGEVGKDGDLYRLTA